MPSSCDTEISWIHWLSGVWGLVTSLPLYSPQCFMAPVHIWYSYWPQLEHGLYDYRVSCWFYMVSNLCLGLSQPRLPIFCMVSCNNILIALFLLQFLPWKHFYADCFSANVFFFCLRSFLENIMYADCGTTQTGPQLLAKGCPVSGLRHTISSYTWHIMCRRNTAFRHYSLLLAEQPRFTALLQACCNPSALAKELSHSLALSHQFSGIASHQLFYVRCNYSSLPYLQ